MVPFKVYIKVCSSNLKWSDWYSYKVILTCSELVLRQGWFDEFSTTVMFRNEAQCAGNGGVLVKCCNAVAGHHSGARRVDLSAEKGGSLFKDGGNLLNHLASSLWAAPSRLAEPVNITL